MERKVTAPRSWPNQFRPQTQFFFKTLCTNMTANSAQFAVSKVASDDLDLVHAGKRGDLAAFEQLVEPQNQGKHFLLISSLFSRCLTEI
jgi:hypothetical protein